MAYKDPENTLVMETSKGTVVIEMRPDLAPGHVEHIKKLAREKFYDGIKFHRVIEGFMIQGGDYENADGTGGEGCRNKYLPDEFAPKLSHTRGMVSMANKGPDTNSSQFFIVQEDATFLDGRHSIIGKVIEGMDVVDKIAGVNIDQADRPIREITIKRAIPAQ